MFCGTLGGAKMTNYIKRSSRFDECEDKNTLVVSPHNYFSSEVGCDKDFDRFYFRHIFHSSTIRQNSRVELQSAVQS